jgi:hypothetical protein
MSLLNWIALLMSFKYSNLIGVVLGGGENFFNLMNIYWKTIINCVIHRKYSKVSHTMQPHFYYLLCKDL